jgi:hypothetical protein
MRKDCAVAIVTGICGTAGRACIAVLIVAALYRLLSDRCRAAAAVDSDLRSIAG